MRNSIKPAPIAIALWLFPFLSNAEPETSIAIKGGPNAATLAHDNRDNKYGFSGGFSGILQGKLTDQLSLGGQIELMYTPRGAEAVVDGVTQGEFREHYIDLTLAVHPEVSFGALSVYLVLGGSLNFLLSANKDNIGGPKEDITSGLRRIDIALLGGIGAGWHLPHRDLGPFRLGTVFLEARHDIGLIDTDNANGGYKNRTSSLMLGLSFAVGGPPSPSPSPGPVK